MFKYFKIIFLVCILKIFLVDAKEKSSRSVSNSSCIGFINVSGTTNINSFELKNRISSLHLDEIKIDSNIHNLNSIAKIKIPVKEFETNNPILYKDFLRLLKANAYPFINIGINYPFLKEVFITKADTKSRFEITIAGITKSYEILCEIVSCSEDYIYIRGSKKIKLSEFNLHPPKKFHGLIKVNDGVMINFGIVLNLDDDKLLSFESKH